MNSSLYIHIPYCRHKCIYCDFFSGGSSIADWNAFAAKVMEELDSRLGELTFPLISLYLGGGTPSLMPADTLSELFSGLKSRLPELNENSNFINDSRNKSPEITLEVNPEDVTPQNIENWKNCGINRISVGLQSFSDDILKFIGRKHSAEQSRRALRLLSEEFGNVSADLIFGLPGQSMKSFADDLDFIIKSGIRHISCYSLMFEPGTALYELRRQHRLDEADEGLSRDMYNLLSQHLNEAGYRHYEISNFAIPGYESLHNTGYWTGRQYLGLGPSAHSFDGKNTRRANPWKLKEYLNHDFRTNTFYAEEKLTRQECIEESIMLGLRMDSGINIVDFNERFGSDEYKILLKKAIPMIDKGFLILTPSELKLTGKGVMISDNIISSLF